MQSSLSGSTTQRGFATGHATSPLSSSWRGQCHSPQDTPHSAWSSLCLHCVFPRHQQDTAVPKAVGLTECMPQRACIRSLHVVKWEEMKTAIILVVFPLCQHTAHSDIKNGDVIPFFPTCDRRNEVSLAQPSNASIPIKTEYKGIKKTSCFLFFSSSLLDPSSAALQPTSPLDQRPHL